jgi:hypothetical protein
MTLPCSWSAETPAAVQLSRKFQAPRFDPSQEALFLRLEHVAGLVQILLNRRIIAGPARGDEVMIVPLGEPLPPRNQLILNVEPTVGSGWGEIALVIAGRGVCKEESNGTERFE